MLFLDFLSNGIDSVVGCVILWLELVSPACCQGRGVTTRSSSWPWVFED